jgi:hypothetical protein
VSPLKIQNSTEQELIYGRPLTSPGWALELSTVDADAMGSKLGAGAADGAGSYVFGAGLLTTTGAGLLTTTGAC